MNYRNERFFLTKTFSGIDEFIEEIIFVWLNWLEANRQLTCIYESQNGHVIRKLVRLDLIQSLGFDINICKSL